MASIFLSPCLLIQRFLHREWVAFLLWQTVFARHRGYLGYVYQNMPYTTVQNLSCNHFLNHLKNHFVNLNRYPFQNALHSHFKGVNASRNVSQVVCSSVILEAMQRQKQDPKHVRNFFYRHALSVRLMTLCFDSIWWLITTGFFRILLWFGQLLGAMLPIWFFVNEHLRRLHTFIVGRTVWVNLYYCTTSSVIIWCGTKNHLW